MADARQILPETTYFFTRRCSERRYFLRPDGFIVKAFLFVLAFALKRYGVDLVACCVMGNHWHAVLVDHHGKLPRFAAMVHRLVAKCTNAFRGRWEAMWSAQRYSAIALHSAEDTIDKIVYTLINPIRASLVATVEDWPGLIIGPHLGLDIVHKADKPNRFFRKKSRTIPTSASFELVKPPTLSDLSDEEYVELIISRLAEREREIAEELENEGRSVMGAEAVLAVDPNSAPSTWEPKRDRNPQVIAQDKALRLRLIQLRLEFLAAYHQARDLWRRGKRRTKFPAGTYWMKHFYRVHCAEHCEHQALAST